MTKAPSGIKPVSEYCAPESAAVAGYTYVGFGHNPVIIIINNHNHNHNKRMKRREYR